MTVAKMKPSKARDYLSAWLYDTHYSKKILCGNLMNRIKQISSRACYIHIVNHCFNGKEPEQIGEPIAILNQTIKDIITALHAIDASATGTFMDYLTRRIIAEIKQEDFIDGRADTYTEIDQIRYLEEQNNNTNTTSINSIWNYYSEGGYWIVFEEPDMKSKRATIMGNGSRFIEIERKNEWMKIQYNSYEQYTGWVRYLIPKSLAINFQAKTTEEEDIKNYVPNTYFSKVENELNASHLIRFTNHYCNEGCKTLVEKYGNTIRTCKFYKCQNMCYKKAKDTKHFKTQDIIKEIFITSLCHAEDFEQVLTQEKFDNIIKTLEKMDATVLQPLVELCKCIAKRNILLNPTVGDHSTIPADCDIIVDNTIIDIKCTNKNNDVLEMMQTLGYASILKHKKKCERHMSDNISNICIMNLFKCECRVFSIDHISKKELLEYYNLLKNEYDSAKERKIKKSKIKAIENTPF